MMDEMTRSYRLPPQVGRPSTISAMMLDVLIALVPALGMAAFFFGPRVLALSALSVAVCVGSEWLCRRLTGQSNTVGDLSACVTGLLLAMSLPAGAPYWAPVLGGTFAIVVVKQFYGGLGKNFMNPALAGRMLLATFPILMTSWSQPLDRLALGSVDAVSAATPMSYLHAGALPPVPLHQLFLGYQGGCLGEVSSFALLLGGAYLILRRVISPRIPLSFLGTAAVIAFFTAPEGVSPLTWTAAQVLSGGLFLGAFFFAADPVTSPITPRGHVLFGMGCGALTMLLRYHSSYPEGVGWAILTMNCLVWLLDRAGMPRRFGAGPFSVLRAWAADARASLAEIRFVKPEIKFHIPHPPRPKEGEAPGEAAIVWLRGWVKGEGRAPCALAGTFLGVCLAVFAVHLVTDLPTAQAEARAQQERLAQVMPKAVTSSETPYRAPGALSIWAGYDAEGQVAGYCVEVQAQGFQSILTLEVGVDINGQVTGVAVVSHGETPDVGTEAMTPESLRRYTGRSGTIRTSGRNAISAVSGATATSNAITAGVNRALAIVASLDTSGDVVYTDTDGTE